MTHFIVWSFDRDTVSAQAQCDDEDCRFRWVCTDNDCEVMHGVEPTTDGFRHLAYDSEADADDWHEMVKASYCNFDEWINGDPGMIPEIAEGKPTFEIGRVAVEPVWLGEDGAAWKLPEAGGRFDVEHIHIPDGDYWAGCRRCYYDRLDGIPPLGSEPQVVEPADGEL